MKQIVIITLLLSCAFVEAQVQVIVYKQDGTLHKYVCSEGGELRFSDSNLIINYGTDALDVHPVIPRSDIRKITFEDMSSGISAASGEKPFSVFPNPAHSFVSIQGFQETEIAYAIYAADGRKLLSGIAHEADKIDVGNLPAGLYFMKTNNKQVKFIKL